MVVYLVTNLLNGKVYVGRTIHAIHTRWIQHCHDARRGGRSYLHRAIRKYGRASFATSVLAACFSLDELYAQEAHFIKLLDSCNPRRGYNRTFGGDGCTPTAEVRQQMSRAHKGIKLSEEHRQRISLSHVGLSPSKETRAKISLAHKGKQHTLGKHHSEQTKVKISLSNLGQRRSAQTKANLRRARQGRRIGEETKRKVSLALRAYWMKRRSAALDNHCAESSLSIAYLPQPTPIP